MLIDWFTVGAQALNFIILVWLLKRFLYKPILDAVKLLMKNGTYKSILAKWGVQAGAISNPKINGAVS